MGKEWFDNAKFGIFLHWGIYSYGDTSESWDFGGGKISYNEYMKNLNNFTADSYAPEQWAELFKKAGAKYAVLTAKHHDGVCLFDTEYTDLTVSKKTPAGRDLIAPYCSAMQRAGIKTGVYFSGTDWSDTDHMRVLIDKTENEILDFRDKKTNYVSMWPVQTAKLKQDKNFNGPYQKEWSRFLERYKGELRELLTNYGKIDLFWTDAMLYRQGYSWDTENVKNMITSLQPDILANGRLDGFGDYISSEQRLPLRPISDTVWEMCFTLNDSWGYRIEDKHYKDVYQVVRLFTQCISMGGNMLLGIGPYANGEVPQKAQEILVRFGEWIHRYGEAVYGTKRGLGNEYYRGDSTVSKDNKAIYIFIHGIEKCVMINGLRNTPKRVINLKNGRELSWDRTGGAPWGNIPGCLWIRQDELDEICTAIKIELDEEMDLWEISEPQDFGAQTKEI